MKKYPGKITGFAMKHLAKKPATIAYPAGKLIIDPNYRGRIKFDSTNCIGCKMCSRDCPAKAVTVERVGDPADKKFALTFDWGRCIYCAQCVDSCPKKCLSTTPDIELASLDRAALKVKYK